MKKYIEAIEDIEGKPEDYVGDFIQEEVEANFDSTKQKKAKDKVKAKEKAGKTYKYRLHTCNHDEENRTGACTVEEI